MSFALNDIKLSLYFKKKIFTNFKSLQYFLQNYQYEKQQFHD